MKRITLFVLVLAVLSLSCCATYQAEYDPRKLTGMQYIMNFKGEELCPRTGCPGHPMSGICK